MRLVTRALEQGRIYTVNSEVTNQLGSSQRSGNGKPYIPPVFNYKFWFTNTVAISNTYQSKMVHMIQPKVLYRYISVVQWLQISV